METRRKRTTVRQRTAGFVAIFIATAIMIVAMVGCAEKNKLKNVSAASAAQKHIELSNSWH